MLRRTDISGGDVGPALSPCSPLDSLLFFIFFCLFLFFQSVQTRFVRRAPCIAYDWHLSFWERDIDLVRASFGTSLRFILLSSVSREDYYFPPSSSRMTPRGIFIAMTTLFASCGTKDLLGSRVGDRWAVPFSRRTRLDPVRSDPYWGYRSDRVRFWFSFFASARTFAYRRTGNEHDESPTGVFRRDISR